MSLASRWTFRYTRDVLRRLPSKCFKDESPCSASYVAARYYSSSVSRWQEQQHPPPNEPPSANSAVSDFLREASTNPTSNLVAEISIPEDRHGILQPEHPAVSILANPTIIIQRQLEMMNVLVGFEQANRYIIMDTQGDTIGFLAEQDHGVGSAVSRQLARTHRSFTTHVFDRHEREVLRFYRPFSWINSRIRVYDSWGNDGSHRESSALSGVSASSIVNSTSSQVSSLPLHDLRLIGEAQQQWNALRRKYNLFLHRPNIPQDDLPALTAGDLPLSNSTAVVPVTDGEQKHRDLRGLMAQFAYVNEILLSWDFTLRSETDEVIGSVNKNFAGLGREIFTDTSVYALRMDAAALAAQEQSPDQRTYGTLGMTLDQRAVMLATAVSIDFDYFSRHSHAGGGWGYWPLWMGGSSEGAAGGAAAGGVAGEAAGGIAGAEAGAAGAVGGVARRAGSVGAGEGAIAGAGTMAGYEAMQRGRPNSDQNYDESNRSDNSVGGLEPNDGLGASTRTDSAQSTEYHEGLWPRSNGGNISSGADSNDTPNSGDGGGDGDGNFDWSDWL